MNSHENTQASHKVNFLEAILNTSDSGIMVLDKNSYSSKRTDQALDKIIEESKISEKEAEKIEKTIQKAEETTKEVKKDDVTELKTTSYNFND